MTGRELIFGDLFPTIVRYLSYNTRVALYFTCKRLSALMKSHVIGIPRCLRWKAPDARKMAKASADEKSDFIWMLELPLTFDLPISRITNLIVSGTGHKHRCIVIAKHQDRELQDIFYSIALDAIGDSWYRGTSRQSRSFGSKHWRLQIKDNDYGYSVDGLQLGMGSAKLDVYLMRRDGERIRVEDQIRATVTILGVKGNGVEFSNRIDNITVVR